MGDGTALDTYILSQLIHCNNAQRRSVKRCQGMAVAAAQRNTAISAYQCLSVSDRPNPCAS